MSTISLFDNISVFSKSENGKKFLEDYHNCSDLQNINFSNRIKIISPNNSTLNFSNKNGLIVPKKKFESNVNIKMKGEIKKFNYIYSNRKNSLLNQSKIQNFSYYGKNLETNLLESNENYSKELGDFSKNPEFKTHLYENHPDYQLSKPILAETPSISKLFKRNIKKENNFSIHTKNFIKIIFRANSCQPQTSKNILKDEKGLKIDKTLKINKIKKLPEEQNNTININSNIPDNFLINFNIVDINIQKIGLFQKQDFFNAISLKDMENYINSICLNLSKNDFNFSNGDFIEFKKIDIEEEKNISFLQKKRKFNFNLDEFNSKDPNKICDGNYIPLLVGKPLKKKYKKNNKKISLKKKLLNKINNRKNGKKNKLYLNQIKINKNILENFPFSPMLNNNENLKIELIQGIFEKKELIRMKKKVEIIKDERNLKFINNKKFELIYKKKDDGAQYIFHIYGYNILNLILYYYNEIKKRLILLNKLHYSHSSFKKSKIVSIQLENLIKKCNKIVREIVKENH